MRLAVNGFGRIGRLVARIAVGNPELELVGVNDISDARTLAHLFKHDSVHGPFKGEVSHREGELAIEGRAIRVTSIAEPARLPWKELDVDIVVESTGEFRTLASVHDHIKAGAKKVIISAPPAGDGIRSFVMGVNHESYDPMRDHVVSNASCTANCVVPVAKVLHDNFCIRQGFVTTVHPYTNDQRILDRTHKDPRRARAAAMSMIPTSTGAAEMVGVILPELKGRIEGMAIRVPTPDTSIVDFGCVVETKTSVEEVNETFKAASAGPLDGIMRYMTEPLVSVDLVGDPHSAIFDSQLTSVVDGCFVNAFAWHDNEYGYACRVVDLTTYIARQL